MAIDDGLPPIPLETKARYALQDLDAIDQAMLDGPTVASISRLVTYYSRDLREEDVALINAKIEASRRAKREREIAEAQAKAGKPLLTSWLEALTNAFSRRRESAM